MKPSRLNAKKHCVEELSYAMVVCLSKERALSFFLIEPDFIPCIDFWCQCYMAFIRLKRIRKRRGKLITALVVGVTVVTLDPNELHGVDFEQVQKLFP